MIKKLLKRISCKHEFVEKIGWQEQYDRINNIRYSERTYRCFNCGKIFTVDGRRDPYDR